MTLPVRINSELIADILVKNQVDAGSGPDDVNTYDWQLRWRSRRRPDRAGTVKHRMGDGALALAGKVFAAAAKSDTTKGKPSGK